jgi:hypothetical protein
MLPPQSFSDWFAIANVNLKILLIGFHINVLRQNALHLQEHL